MIQHDVTSIWVNDPAITSRGGVVSIDDLTELEKINWDILKGLMEKAIADIKQTHLVSEIENLTFLLIDSSEINAFVLDAGEKQLIGLCKGLITKVWNTLVTIMANSTVLPEYFRNQFSATNDTEISTEKNHSIRSNINAKTAFIPEKINEDRLELTTLLYQIMMDFVIHHELAHVVRGHTSLLKRKFSLSMVEEKIKIYNKNKEILDMLNVMEIDADVHGLDMLFQHDPDIDILSSMEKNKQRISLFLYMFPYVLMAQMFDLENTSIEYQLNQSHPPPLYRAIIYTRAVGDSFESISSLSFEEIKDEHNIAWYEASRCAKVLKFPEGRWRENMNDIDMQLVDSKQAEYKIFEKMLDAINTQ